jgi:hypothetical protein
MEKTNKFCQSCGMPLKKDEKGGGTNSDGSLSLTYCSYCYQAGAFTRQEMTAKEMKELVKDKMKEMGFPGFIAGFFTWNIPRLERWKK